MSRTKHFCSLKSKYLPLLNLGLVMLLLVVVILIFVSIFIQTACISHAPSHVPQYHVFHTALFYFMFNLPLTNSSQQRKTTRHCITLIKSSLVVLILRSKRYYRVVTVLIRVRSLDRRLHFCSFQTKLVKLCPVVCFKGGKRGTCLGPPLLGAPPWGVTHVNFP